MRAVVRLSNRVYDQQAVVRGASLATDDPLVDEWYISMLGPLRRRVITATAAPTATGASKFILIFDRDLGLEVTAALIARIIGAPTHRLDRSNHQTGKGYAIKLVRRRPIAPMMHQLKDCCSVAAGML